MWRIDIEFENNSNFSIVLYFIAQLPRRWAEVSNIFLKT
jgi:hypothetical protein